MTDSGNNLGHLVDFSTDYKGLRFGMAVATYKGRRTNIMAKLKATPKNYAEAQAALAGRESVRLGNNTYLENVGEYGEYTGKIGVRLHNTYVVVFYPHDGCITLHTGGYRTVTTKERINQFITGRVWQKSYSWYYSPAIEIGEDGKVRSETIANVIFSEGMTV